MLRAHASRCQPRAALAVLALAALAPWAACRGAGADAAAPAAGDLAVRRGDLAERVLLTGELEAARAAELTVPRTQMGMLQIRWMVDEGATVPAGAPVVEFDNTEFTSELEEKRSTAAQSADDLARAEAEAASTAAEKAFDVEQRKAELAKARIQADIPTGLLAERERQERQLAARRAEVELEKAVVALAAHRRAAAADLAGRRVALGKTQREIRDTERVLSELVLRAPTSGFAIPGDNPTDSRKVRTGDRLWSGLPVMRIPDLDSLGVEAALSDVDDGRIALGQRAVCTLDAYPGERFGARIVEISPVARESARSSLLRAFTVRLALDRLDLSRMRPGMSVKVEVESRAVRGALLAPRAALDLSGPTPRALLAGGGAAPVRLGPCDAQRCAVAGLAAGTRLRPRGISGRAGMAGRPS